MGRNAQRRRTLKVFEKAEKPRQVRHRGPTKTMQRLRQRMRAVSTLAQFEQILSTGHEDNRGKLRRLLAPMLRPGLPCCGQALYAAKMGRQIEAGQHSLYCPTRFKSTIVPVQFEPTLQPSRPLSRIDITRIPE